MKILKIHLKYILKVPLIFLSLNNAQLKSIIIIYLYLKNKYNPPNDAWMRSAVCKNYNISALYIVNLFGKKFQIN